MKKSTSPWQGSLNDSSPCVPWVIAGQDTCSNPDNSELSYLPSLHKKSDCPSSVGPRAASLGPPHQVPRRCKDEGKDPGFQARALARTVLRGACRSAVCPAKSALQRRGITARRSQLIKKVHLRLSELPPGGRSHPIARVGAKGLEGESPCL